MTGRHVALLRGINVGGKHRLPMKELVALFEAAGAGDVRTYIQSGNVVFAASAAIAKQVPAAVAAGISKRFGFDAPVVTRTAAQWKALAKHNPFLKRRCDPSTLHVALLAAKPSAKLVKALDADRSPGDAFAVLGSEVFLHLPNGVARTKLSNAWLDRALDTVSTVRNWRTVEALAALCDSA